MGRKYNIGIDINKICKKYNIKNYTVKPDGKVDVDGNVWLSNKSLTKLPLDFGVVKGDFNCFDNYLITLEGAPEKVGGGFNCYNNNLTTLKGAPKEVGGGFYCSSNNLTTLKGAPEYVGSNFSCSSNNLTSLEFAPDYVGGDFSCSSNNLTTLEFAPVKVGGDFYCFNNKIIDVETLVKCNIGGKFYIDDNPISSIIDDIEDLEHFYLIRPLNGNKLSKELYDEVREDLRLPEFNYSKLHSDIELID